MKNMETRETVVALFNFLSEYSKVRTKPNMDIDKELRYWELDSVPCTPDVSFDYRKTDAFNESRAEGSCLLKVRKPKIAPCPEPPEEIRDWIESGWEDYKKGSPRIIKTRRLEQDDEGVYILFDDDPARPEAYELWCERRGEWKREIKPDLDVLALFNSLFEIHGQIKNDGSSKELLVATGVVRAHGRDDINYPLLVKRVSLSFDAQSNTINVLDTDVDTQLVATPLSCVEGLNHDALSTVERNVKEGAIHPLDRGATLEVLRGAAHELSMEGEYYEGLLSAFSTKQEKLMILQDPVLLYRERPDGTAKAVSSIIDNINAGGEIPNHILKLIGAGAPAPVVEYEDRSLEEELAEVGGEDPDILLPKPANSEQLNIARRVESDGAVIVQGPPGTGKTHTIANLMCHLLAEGKRVLVTSQKDKALAVLKSKLPDQMQNLCVSVSDDSQADMERAIQGIIERRSREDPARLRMLIAKAVEEREATIKKLASERKKIFEVLGLESAPLRIAGEDVSPSAAAAFVHDHALEFSGLIPGPVDPESAFPFSDDELARLYELNDIVSAGDEAEVSLGLPSRGDVPNPDDVASIIRALDHRGEEIQAILDANNWTIESQGEGVAVVDLDGEARVNVACSADVEWGFSAVERRFTTYKPWFAVAASHCEMGDGCTDPWLTLVDHVGQAAEAYKKQTNAELLKPVSIDSAVSIDDLEEGLELLSDAFDKKGRIGFFDKRKKAVQSVLATVKIAGRAISSLDDCKLVKGHIELDTYRASCEGIWNKYVAAQGGPRFEELSEAEPLLGAAEQLGVIRWWMDWEIRGRGEMYSSFEEAGLKFSYLADTEPCSLRERLANEFGLYVKSLAPLHELVAVLRSRYRAEEEISSMEELLSALSEGSHWGASLAKAVGRRDIDSYEAIYARLSTFWNVRTAAAERLSLIARVSKAAPVWSHDLKGRTGIHGKADVPGDMRQAWKWAQCSGALDNLQQRVGENTGSNLDALAETYRQLTAKLCEQKAWFALIEMLNRNAKMAQALGVWANLNKKIGKGTGKQAASNKAKARAQMRICQSAVPAWIASLPKALEMFDPAADKFDVIIIDEASQAPITAVPVMFFAKKVVVVGDDKQVSPEDIGLNSEEIERLRELTIADKFDVAKVLAPGTSLYDLAKIAYTPLMLREHFRCVPDIIGYSNNYSYDHRILPLREPGSSCLLPAVVSHRTPNGMRNGTSRTNDREAEEIAAIIKACIEQPEYAGKTFGVISLLGAEQPKIMRGMIIDAIGEAEYESRQIICGTSAELQGDERDVVLLSMVDSPSYDEDGVRKPLRLMGDGKDGNNLKRYNVAVSRACDQLWIVHSLDFQLDLKVGDLRRGLLEYAADPHARDRKRDEVEKKADSPFEVEVAMRLHDAGYSIEQQWPVGSYRLDIVVEGENGRVAVECDGERYHSGEEKILEDMRRQTILERIGWRFIRIRGSEFYRDPDTAMKRVFSELNYYGIRPLDDESRVSSADNSELLDRIEGRVRTLLAKKGIGAAERNDAIATALSRS